MAIKKSMEALVAYLSNETIAQKQIGTIVKSDEFMQLVTAQRGGGNPEDNWLTVDGLKVGRICAMLGAWYNHDNEDKAVSNFYRNGSYHIVVEKLKNLYAKAHKEAQGDVLAQLENDMVEGVITPKEWLEAKNDAVKPFTFELSAETKAELVTLTNGYASKEDLAEALLSDADTSYSAIEDAVGEYLATIEAELFPTEEEATEEA